jgi:hypothetical protein
MLFGLSIMVTLALLAALVTTGLMRERRLHLIVFFPTAASLLSAIYLAGCATVALETGSMLA